MGIGFDSQKEWADEIYGRNDIGIDDEPFEDDIDYDDYSDEEEEDGEE